jgi:hypothetical protein
MRAVVEHYVAFAVVAGIGVGCCGEKSAGGGSGMSSADVAGIIRDLQGSEWTPEGRDAYRRLQDLKDADVLGLMPYLDDKRMTPIEVQAATESGEQVRQSIAEACMSMILWELRPNVVVRGKGVRDVGVGYLNEVDQLKNWLKAHRDASLEDMRRLILQDEIRWLIENGRGDTPYCRELLRLRDKAR